MHFRIIMIQFQDKYNWDMKVVKKCCIGFAMPDGRTIPFDAYNVLYRDTHEVKHWQNGNSPKKVPMPTPYRFISQMEMESLNRMAKKHPHKERDLT
jgi:uncharacterized radical SAM superfamily Fe-S cluster-containing enzyme